MIALGAVPNFTPSANGFRFINAFPTEPTIQLDFGPLGHVGLGDASNGLCGGMAYTVRDYFEAGLPIPADEIPPALDTPLYNYITKRLIESFNLPAGAAKYADWMMLPDADVHLIIGTRTGTFSRTVNTSWPAIRQDIEDGHPSPLGLVTVHTKDLTQIGKCHQVLAYGYSVDDAGVVNLSVYDPNTLHNEADDAFIRFDSSDPQVVSPITHNLNIAESTLHGFFRSGYDAKVPPS
jgi:hypothetical protein